MLARRKLIALQDANCTTEGREFDFGQAGTDAAEEAVRVSRSGAADAVLVRLQESFRAIVQVAEVGLCVQVERVGA